MRDQRRGLVAGRLDESTEPLRERVRVQTGERLGLAEPGDVWHDQPVALGEPLDHRSDLLFRLADGRRSCDEIDRALYDQTRVAEPREARQGRWLDLANHGFVLLESPDPRQHVDCVHLGPIRDRAGQTAGAVIVFSDVSRERRMKRLLSYQAAHDALTGLINRREFESRLTTAIESARAYCRSLNASLERLSRSSIGDV